MLGQDFDLGANKHIFTGGRPPPDLLLFLGRFQLPRPLGRGPAAPCALFAQFREASPLKLSFCSYQVLGTRILVVNLGTKLRVVFQILRVMACQ